MPRKIKLILSKRPPERLNMLSRTSLSQSGSILLQPHLQIMYFDSVLGRQMWDSAQRESLPDTGNISMTYSPFHWELICNLLSQLSEIGSSVNTLSQTLDSELLCLNLPLFINSSFRPLHLFLKYHNLDADLEKVKAKAALVTSMKVSIKGQMDMICKKLYAAKSTWKENWDKLQLKKAEQNRVKHSTGKDRIYFHYFPFPYVTIS